MDTHKPLKSWVVEVRHPIPAPLLERQREFFIDNLLVRIRFIIVMIRWTGLAPWEFELLFPGRRCYIDAVAGRRHGSERIARSAPPPLLLPLPRWARWPLLFRRLRRARNTSTLKPQP